MIFRMILMGMLCSPIGLAWAGILGHSLVTGLWVAFLFGAGLALIIDAFLGLSTQGALKELKDFSGDKIDEDRYLAMYKAGTSLA